MTDLKMPGMDGIALLEAVKKLQPKTAVIVLTAFATIETAVEATQKGAFDYITKPFRQERILLTVDKAMQWQEMVRENLALRQALEEKEGFASLVGASPVMRDIFERIPRSRPPWERVDHRAQRHGQGAGRACHPPAQPAQPGENGHRELHRHPQEVLESELFGHVKGAFTGAWKEKKGLVEEPTRARSFWTRSATCRRTCRPSCCGCCRRGIQARRQRRDQEADLRIVAATNHDLKTGIREKLFREDLYYRLNVIQFELPPLRERKEDIALLSRHFLAKYAAVNRKTVKDISPEATQVLMAYEFPATCGSWRTS